MITSENLHALPLYYTALLLCVGLRGEAESGDEIGRAVHQNKESREQVNQSTRTCSARNWKNF